MDTSIKLQPAADKLSPRPAGQTQNATVEILMLTAMILVMAVTVYLSFFDRISM